MSEVRTVPVKLLSSSYDRRFMLEPTSAKNISHITENFLKGIIPSDDLDPIVVHVKKDGSIYAHEGRHRFEALSRLEVKFVVVHVIYFDKAYKNIWDTKLAESVSTATHEELCIISIVKQHF